MNEPSGWDDWNDLGRACGRAAMLVGGAAFGLVLILVGLLCWVWSLIRAD